MVVSRSTFRAALAALALLLGVPSLAGAQDGSPAGATNGAAPNAPATAPTPSPKTPIPYAKLAPKPAASKPKTSPAAASKSAKAAAAPASLRLGAAQPAPPAELQAFVDGVVRSAMRRDHIAGVTVSIVQNGRVVVKKGYGFASLHPDRAVDPDRTLFRIGSISKTFTWIAVMKEVEAGRMRLEQPINLYLPEKLRIPDQGFDNPIRVINLMDHSPGFEDRALGQLFEDDFDRVRPLDVYLRQERPKRVRPAGYVSSYSNYGAALAGEAVSWTSGKPFDRLIEEEILTPAGLAHTTFREPHPVKAGLPAPMSPALAADVSDGFRWTPAGFQPRPYEYIEQIAPAGAASSTAGDMARYMTLLLGNGVLDGVTVYGPQAARAFRTPIRPTPPGINGWAHGFVVESLPGGHQGFGHDGGTLSFFSNMVVVPDLNLGIFISTNTAGGAGLAESFPAAVIRQFYGKPEVFPRPGSPELAQQAASFAGYYLGTRRPYSGLEGFVTRLAVAGTRVSVTPQGRLLLSSAGGASAYVPDGPVEDGRFVGAQDGDRTAFLMRNGRAFAFLPAGGAVLYERVAGWKTPSTLMLFAVLTALAAVLTLGGLVVRSRRDLRESMIQGRAGIVQNIQAGLWLAAMALFIAFSVRASSDLAWVMYNWPGALIILASACALVAAGLSIVAVVALPAIWAGGGRVDSWSYLRKFAFSVTALIYLAFSVLLATWGALSPWSG
ncbi:MAG: beta-lactamase family protein [Alphaproteobacteria bacterium]|nr:beta-lactamase family protein [Alphaproteobacteria bacterium]